LNPESSEELPLAPQRAPGIEIPIFSEQTLTVSGVRSFVRYVPQSDDAKFGSKPSVPRVLVVFLNNEPRSAARGRRFRT